MDGIHPKFVLSKRFPVHAAIEQLDLVNIFLINKYLSNFTKKQVNLKSLLTPASDARFHFGRKLTNTDVSVLHQVSGATNNCFHFFYPVRNFKLLFAPSPSELLHRRVQRDLTTILPSLRLSSIALLSVCFQ